MINDIDGMKMAAKAKQAVLSDDESVFNHMKSPSSSISSYASVSALLIVFAAPSLGLLAV